MLFPYIKILKGNINGTAFITLNEDSTLEGVVIYYPE